MEIRVNDICILDKDNSLKLAGESMTYAKVIKVHKGIFSNSYDVLICNKDGNPISSASLTFKEKQLTKLNPNEVVVIRYPEDVPIVKDYEVNALNKLYMTFLDEYKLSSKLQSLFTERESIILAKLVVKLKLFSEIIHKY